mgnify:CR=1 FL=1
MGVLKELYHVTKFEYVKRSYVSYISEDVYNGEASVTLASGGEWSEIKFTHGTATIGEQRIITENAGPFFRQQFEGSMPAKGESFPKNIRAFSDEPIVCRLTMSNDKVFIVGDNLAPVRLSYNLSSDGHNVLITFDRDSVNGMAEQSS